MIKKDSVTREEILMKKKQKRLRTIAIVVILILASVAGFFGYQYKVLTDSKVQLTNELNKNTQTVYVAVTTIKAGEQLVDGGNIAKQTIRTGLEPSFYITDEEANSYASVNIDEGTPILYAMTTENSYEADTREYEISVAHLMTDQADYDTVDVRIMFPNGEDYIVLPKRKVTNLNMDGSTFTTLANEEEIVRMSSAIIDAWTHAGAYLYTTRYVSDSGQKAATPTYLVKAENIDLINRDPNVLTKAVETLNLDARLSLETRLGLLTEDQVKAVKEGEDAMFANQSATMQSNAEAEKNGASTTSTPAPTTTTTTTTTENPSASDVIGGTQ